MKGLNDMLANLMSKVVKHAFEKNFTYKPIVKEVAGIYDIAYGDHEFHKLDVYYPTNATKEILPILFNIHGGAWVACDKEMNRAYSEYLASFGYCVVNMSYRLLPKTDIKGQVQDVVNAISYVYENMELAVMDKKTCILMGDSAGAHIASLVYCLANDGALNKIFCTKMKALPIKAIVLQNMVSDLSDFTNSKKLYMKFMVQLLFGKNYKTSSLLTRSSFLEVVNENIAKVPVILVGSEHDPLFQQTKKMQIFLKDNGWEHIAIIWTKNERSELGHVFQVSHPEWEESKETHKKIFDYLQEVVRNED